MASFTLVIMRYQGLCAQMHADSAKHVRMLDSLMNYIEQKQAKSTVALAIKSSEIIARQVFVTQHPHVSEPIQKFPLCALSFIEICLGDNNQTPYCIAAELPYEKS